VDDETGTIRVRVPPDGHVRSGDEAAGEGGSASVGCGDRVSVTGRVVRGRDGHRTVTGPNFVLVASP
jgi:hypothetical protein